MPNAFRLAFRRAMYQTRTMDRIDSTQPPNRPTSPERRQVVAASWAVIVVFTASGFVMASWLSRLPVVRDHLELSPAQIGLILLVGACGSVGALPLSGAIVDRFGAARTTLGAAIVGALGLLGVVGAFWLANPWLLAACLVVANAGIAVWDAAMNLEGAMVEQGLGRAIMPVYHAAFSGGTVLGAGLGALMARLAVPFQVHLPLVLVLAVTAVALAVTRYLPEDGGAPHAATAPPEGEVPAAELVERSRSPFAAWLEPRTLLIGLVTLSAALTEGAANDWLSLASIDAFDLSNSDGALMLTVFLCAMTAMRFLGTGLLDRFGRVPILRLCIALALVGLAIFGFAPSAPIAAIGAVAWGLGAALGFPVGMSAASDDPQRAAARVAVVSTIGYSAFLAGPPILGLLAELVGYRSALLFIGIPLIISLFVVKAAAPLPGSVGAAVDVADVPQAEDARES